MNRLLLDVDFSQIEGNQVHSHTGNPGVIHGQIQTVRGYDGRGALYFNNKGGGEADQYVDFGPLDLGSASFTIALWMRTHRDGCNGWPYDEVILPEEFEQGTERTKRQQQYGGVILANMPWDGGVVKKDQAGFSLANLQQQVYFHTCFQGEGGEPLRLGCMKEPDDDRWHLLTVVFDRDGLEQVYLDNTLLKEIDLKNHKGRGAGRGSLILGADGEGKNGLGEMAVSSLRIYSEALLPEEIAARYSLEDIRRIREELGQRPLPPELYDEEAVKEIMEAAGKAEREARTLEERWEKEAVCDWKEQKGQAEALHSRILSSYEAFLLNTRKPDVSFLLISDAHIEGPDMPKALTYGRALKWANELGAQAFADCGDYSNFGKEPELEGYWQAVEKNRGNLVPLVTLGNHETLEKSSEELKSYHLGKLAALGAVFEGYDKLYYEYTAGGCHFLVLSQISDTYTITGYKGMWVHAADLKKAQLTWLEDRLKACSGQGKPVFLFIHNSVREILARQTDGNYKELSIILSSWAHEFYQILDRYPDVVICTGHVHHGLGDSCGAARTRAGYHVVDVPCFSHNQKGYGMSQVLGETKLHTGYMVSVFGSKVLLRAAEFENKSWLTSYDQLIDVQNH